MKTDPLQKLLEYWNEVRAGRIAPRRLEIEPTAIAPILAETFMLERAELDAYPYRLAGTRLCEAFGMELRGRNFLDGWNVADRATLVHNLRSLSAHGAVLRISCVASADVRHALEMESILLPLLHSGDEISRIIGATGVRGEPHWLGRERLVNLRLTDCSVIWPDGRPHGLASRPAEKAPAPVRDLGPVQVVRQERRVFRVLQGGRTAQEPPKR